MSVRIGLIISRDYDINILSNFREKYELGLYTIDNKYVNQQILENEVFLQATKTGCDSFTGIGAFDIYMKDPSIMYKTINDPKLAKSIIEEFMQRKQNYESDAIKWIEIVKTMKFYYKINKVQLFWHNCTQAFEEEKIIFKNRPECEINDISVEFIMKINEDELISFV